MRFRQQQSRRGCPFWAVMMATPDATGDAGEVTMTAHTSSEIWNMHLIIADYDDKYNNWQWSTQLDIGLGNDIWCQTRIPECCG